MTVPTILLNANKEFRDFCGITAFHNAGYRGGRVTACTVEQWDLNEYNPGGLVSSVVPETTPPVPLEANATHAKHTAAVFFQVAPDAKLKRFRGSLASEEWFGSLAAAAADPQISTLFASIGTDSTRNNRAIASSLRSTDRLPAFFAAGNQEPGWPLFSQYLLVEEVRGVAAAGLQDNMVRPSLQSQRSIYVSVTALTRIWINLYAADPADNDTTVSGTSCAAAWLGGMTALVNDFFIDKIGHPLNRRTMYRFLMDHCNPSDIKPIEGESNDGFQERTGWGFPRLPEPAAINWEHYRDLNDFKYNDHARINGWAIDHVYNARVEGLMSGDNYGNFSPLINTDRETLAIVAARVIEKINDRRGTPVTPPIVPGFRYNDHAQINLWAQDAVYQMYALGIMTPDARGNFNPLMPSPRENTAVVFDRVLSYLYERNNLVNPDKIYYDHNEISSWAVNATARLYHLRIMDGDTKDYFHPKDNITREDTACVADRLLTYLVKVHAYQRQPNT